MHFLHGVKTANEENVYQYAFKHIILIILHGDFGKVSRETPHSQRQVTCGGSDIGKCSRYFDGLKITSPPRN
jgi:hypothetical protein